MFMWSTEAHTVQCSTKDSSVLEASQFFLTELSGLGLAVCGDGATCGVWGFSGVLGTGNTGMTCTGEGGLTSPAGIAECCSVSTGFAAAAKAERFRRSDKVRTGFLSFLCHQAIPNFISYPNLVTWFKCWQFLCSTTPVKVALLVQPMRAFLFFYQLAVFYLHIWVQVGWVSR